MAASSLPYVVDDDDGIVDYHADAEYEAGEGYDVHGDAHGVEAEEGEDEGEWNGDGDEQWHLPSAEEEEEDEAGHEGSEDEVPLKVGHAV